MSSTCIDTDNAADMAARSQNKRRAKAMHCPHCDSPMRVRNSLMPSPVCRQGQMDCTNAECGFRSSFTVTLDRTLALAADPNPSVNLPLAPHTRKRMERALEAEHARTFVVSTSD